MTHFLELQSLPAGEGDALWVRWGTPEARYQLMVDMGTEGTGKALRDRFELLEEDDRAFEVLVVTHVDSDHIGGVLSCVADAEPLPGLMFRDVWFNGFEHLHGKRVGIGSRLEPLGPAQGERLSRWLRTQAWNEAFDSGPVWRLPGAPPRTVALPDGLTLTVLGPTPTRLHDLIGTWKTEVEIAVGKGKLDVKDPSSGLEALGRKKPKKPSLRTAADVVALANTELNKKDDSKANGSSIVLLLQYRGRAFLLAGDAHSADLVEGLQHFGGGAPVVLDLFKLPHHGSRKNVHEDVVRAIECPLWLVSTDGTKHYHPDAEAIARIITHSKIKRPDIVFNVPSAYNEWWRDAAWQSTFGYTVRYGTPIEGLLLRFNV